MMRPTSVVTGGTRGIGAAVCARLAADGFEVIAAARRPPPKPLPGVRYESCDVADTAAVQALFAPLDRIDALVCCAGTAGANRLDAEDDSLWHAIVATNLHGAYYCCKAALPRLRNDGRIVVIASVLGLRGAADQTAYCAAKHGAIGLVRALALAVAPRGITVNAVCPGWVDTAMAASRFAELGITRGQAAATLPTGRIVSPQEVAATVAFLLSAEAASITGHALPVDGGGLAAA